ncbi:MAG: dephospho-CoA kinase [Ardenticatenaceae bacterium]|nr:dephospho-CoA kinase [Ardenticatenaceae bacterium]MCB8990639.1 dephospho-CoA kinase [Ardenticatenaceae bacterium]MCB9004346.1 dephospho-CoA kinase [Ardenticatenaceae bacterium]
MSEQSSIVTQTGKLIVGVTGNIATGKSAIMRLAQERGALIIDADKIVHHLMDTDPNMQAAIAVAFGADVRLPNGRINRKTLGKLVFDDPAALHDLEQMVHPSVRIAIAQQMQETDKNVIFIEAIKLIEGPIAAMCHQIWVTRCQKQRQLERLIICRGMTPEMATHRIEAQSPQEEKVAQADVVIDTDGYMHDTETLFNLHWNRLPAPADAPPIELHVPLDSGLEQFVQASPAKAADTKPAAPPERKESPMGLSRPIPKSLKRRLGKTIAKSAPAEETAVPTADTTPKPPPAKAKPAPKTTASSGDTAEIRRARPSDIPSVMLLIHKATNGAVKLKRADLLLALGERSYFIGQTGTEIKSVVGWNIENLVSRVTELYFHPQEAIGELGTAMFDSIETSADEHICEVVVIFLPADAPEVLTQLVAERGYTAVELDKLPATWNAAIRESQPENSTFVIKVLRERVTHPL